MNFQQLLQHRAALLRQARLANLAFAYQRLGDLAARIARARLRGLVRLDPGDPEAERPWPMLTALECSQAVLEEHFLDEDAIELADILKFLGEDGHAEGVTFRLEEVESRFLAPLRRELESAGIILPADVWRIEDSHRGCG